MILNDGFFIEGNMAKVIKYGGIKEGRIEEYREYQDNLKEILEIENIIAILLYYRDLLFSKGNGCNKLVILPNFEMENTYTLRYIYREFLKYKEMKLKLESDKQCTIKCNGYVRLDCIDNISYSKDLRMYIKACSIIDEYPKYWEDIYKKNKIIKECIDRGYNEHLTNMIIKVLEENVTPRKDYRSILSRKRKKEVYKRRDI